MPTSEQLEALYCLSYGLTFTMFQPIHLVSMDDRTDNLYMLAGRDEEIEFQIDRQGEIVNEQ
jgi:hypothetical protein